MMVHKSEAVAARHHEILCMIGQPGLGALGADLITKTEGFECTIATLQTSGTVTLGSTFDTDLTSIVFGGHRQNTTNDDMEDFFSHLVLTSGTVVTGTRQAGHSAPVAIRGTAVEYNSTVVKKVHRGTVTIGASDTSQASTSFDATKANCVPVFTGFLTTEAGDDYIYGYPGLSVTGSDGAVTVTATRGGQDGVVTTTVAFDLIEFQPGKTKSIQEVTVAISGASTSNSTTISSVDLTRCITYYGCQTAEDITIQYSDVPVRVGLTGATTLAAARGQGGANTSTVYATVVEFDDSVNIGNIERKVNQALTDSETIEDVTLTTALTDTSKAFVNYCGFEFLANLADLNPGSQHATQAIQDANTVRLQREVGGVNSVIHSLEVIQG